MTTTTSPLLNLAIQGAGDNDTTWGIYANQDYYYLEQAVAGVAAIALPDAPYTLSQAGATTTTNAEAYQGILNFSGTLTAVRTVTIPIKPKSYLVRNGTTGGFALTLSAGSNTVSIPNGVVAFVFCDSAGLIYAVNGADAFTATTLATTGNATIGGNLSLTGNVSSALALANNLTTPAAYSVNFGSGQFVKDASGNIQTAAGNTIAFGTNQFFKDASGNIGIGTATPTVTFDVRGLVSAAGTPTKAPISTVSITGVGVGYTAGNTLTVVGGSGSGATLYVDTVSGGTITGVHVLAAGSGYVVGDSLTVTGGSGAGATFTVATVANLTTAGDTNLTGLVATRGAMNVLGALNAYSTLGVSGATTLTGAVTMSGAATVNGALIVNQNGTFNGSTVSIANGLTVGGTVFGVNVPGTTVGVGVSGAATSTLQVNGPIATKQPTLLSSSTGYTVLSTDSTIICDNPGSAVTLTLPDPSTCPGRILYIGCYTAKNINSSASNIVGPGGTTSATIVPSTNTFSTIQASGSVWRVIART